MAQLKKRIRTTPNTGRSKDEDKPLTDRAWLMLKHYLTMEVPNQFQAYKMAGYSARGTAGYVAASQIFNQANFQKALRAEIENRKQRFSIEADMMLKNLVNLASANIKDVCEWTSNTLTVKPSAELTRDQTYPIIEVKETKHKDGDITVSVRLCDKVRPLELAMTHLGLLLPDGTKGVSIKERALQIKEAVDAMFVSVPVAPPQAEATPTPSQFNEEESPSDPN